MITGDRINVRNVDEIVTDGVNLLVATKDFCATVPRKGSTTMFN